MTTDIQLPKLAEIWLSTINWQPDNQQQEQFQQLYEEIVTGNRQLNLTRITEPNEFWEKHLWDSLAGLKGLELAKEIAKAENLSIIDIGTGAGFPGIPVAIAFPFWTVTLLDSTRKKINFLEDLIPKLSLKNTKTLIGRVEEIGQNSFHRQTYDIALIRAVSEASVCAEYTLPLLKIGGLAILYRGHWSEQDNLLLQPALNQLGGQIEKVIKLVAPLSESIRHCIYLRKISSTPVQFPRKVGTPERKSL
jgi:16S rRNA (guanine527-N7)-methyltransferase